MAKRILVIDDEPKIRQLLEALLALHHYDVLTAAGGREALDLLVTEPADLILLDVIMPGVDGWQVLRELKMSEQTRSIPVIMLTAQGDAHAVMASQELRATDYFIKPFQAEELLAFIRRYLPP